jgi:ABC-2 type transport system permease protein
MKKMIIILKREFLTKVVTRGFIIGTLLGPIIMIGIMLGPAYFMTLSHESPMTIAVVDNTDQLYSGLTESLTDTLSDGQPRYIFTKIRPEDYTENQIYFRSKVDEGNINAILVIPKNIMGGEEVTYISRVVSDFNVIQSLRNALTLIVNNKRLAGAGLNPQQIKELTQQVNVKTVKVIHGEEKERGFDQEYISSMIFLIILYMTIILYGTSMMRGVIEEKTSRIVEIMLSSTNSFRLLLGKLFGVGAVGLVQYLIWAAMASVVFFLATQSMPAIADYINISPAVLFYFVLFFIVGFFTFSTLYTAVGAMCSDMQDAQSLSMPVTMMLILPFIISFMVIRDPTSDIARILSFLPFFAPLIMFLRISLVMPPLWEIAACLLINFVTILFITWVAARIYRIGILMYGKRPTVPELIRWIRYQ